MVELKFRLSIGLVICLGWVVHSSYGQSSDLSIKMARHNYVLEEGSELDVEITIESMSDRKVRILDIKASGSKAIPIEIAPSTDYKNLYLMNLKVPAETKLGKYTYVLTGLGPEAHRLKGITFSINVVDQAPDGPWKTETQSRGRIRTHPQNWLQEHFILLETGDSIYSESIEYNRDRNTLAVNGQQYPIKDLKEFNISEGYFIRDNLPIVPADLVRTDKHVFSGKEPGERCF